jgi:hypothetical protein
MIGFGQSVYRGSEEYRRYLNEASAQVTEEGYLNVDEIRAIDA